MKRKTVAVNCETIVPKINENGWSDASFSRLVRKYPSWFSEVKRGRNLPSPEEAARMCVLLKTTPDEILVEQNDIDLVNALLDNEMAKEKTPDPKIEGVTDTQKAAIDFVLTLPPEKLRKFIKLAQAVFEDEQHD